MNEISNELSALVSGTALGRPSAPAVDHGCAGPGLELHLPPDSGWPSPGQLHAWLSTVLLSA